MATGVGTVCGLPAAMALIGALFVVAISLCVSLAGLAAAEFRRPPAWRTAITCGSCSIAIAIAILRVFHGSTIGGNTLTVMSFAAGVFGVLAVAAGILRFRRGKHTVVEGGSCSVHTEDATYRPPDNQAVPRSMENPYKAPAGIRGASVAEQLFSSPRAIIYFQVVATVVAVTAGASESSVYIPWVGELMLVLPLVMLAQFFCPMIVLGWCVFRRTHPLSAIWSVFASIALSIAAFLGVLPLVQ